MLKKVQPEVGTDNSVAATHNPAVTSGVAVDGLPVPHKRCRWNKDEIVEFVSVWNSSASIQEVMERMNRSLAACYSMAKQCRRNGIVLRVLGRSSAVDWEAIKSELPS